MPIIDPPYIPVGEVGGFNPSEKYESVRMIIHNIWQYIESHKCHVPNHQPVYIRYIPSLHYCHSDMIPTPKFPSPRHWRCVMPLFQRRCGSARARHSPPSDDLKGRESQKRSHARDIISQVGA